MTRFSRFLAGTALFAVAVLAWHAAGVSARAQAPVASDWQEGLNSRVRLVAGTAGEDAARYAGVEIRLEEGWKTYWRNPGDAGIPPVFDWSGSDNLASADVLYPLPHRLKDPAGTSIGYKGGVLFPVRITAEDDAKPVLVNLKLNYAVCEEFCIPADATLFLAVPAGEAGAAPSAAIAGSLARVPGAAGAGLPRVTGAALAGDGKKRHLAVTVVHETDAAVPDLFVEGPEAWYLGVPEETGRKEGDGGLTITYAVPVRGKVEDGGQGAALRATIAAGARGVEQRVTLP